MLRLYELHDSIFGGISKALGDWFLPTLARFAFAAVLFTYFWKSAMTKLGDGIFGIFSPSLNAYAQIFPKKMEAVGYDPAGLGAFEWLVAVAGTAAEIILPILILVGLFTRLAALGMIGFVFVQSFVDVTGHGVGGKDLGAWFDAPSGSLIMDQRLLWVVLFLMLLKLGAGPLSLDRVLKRQSGEA